jgi:hypothetical protein
LALLFNLLLIYVAEVLADQLSQLVLVFVCFQLHENLLHNEEALLVFDHALHDVFLLEHQEEVLDGSLESRK